MRQPNVSIPIKTKKNGSIAQNTIDPLKLVFETLKGSMFLDTKTRTETFSNTNKSLFPHTY